MRLCLVLVSAILAFPAFALEPTKAITQYRYDSWNADDHGLPQNTVNQIVQDGDGYLWIGTYSGVARFDGVRFSPLSAADDQVSTNVVGALLADGHGRLWVGTSGEGLIMVESGRVTRVWTAPHDGPLSNYINDMCEDDEGFIWIATDVGLNRFADNRFTAFLARDGLPDRPLLSVTVGPGGAIWLGTNGAGIARLDAHTAAPVVSEILDHGNVRAVVEDGAGGLWIGTYGSGLMHYRAGEVVSYTTGDGLSSNLIMDLLLDRHGSLWIATNRGLNRLHRQRIDAFTEDHGLSNNVVRCLFEDRSGSLWFGTNGGLNRLSDGRITTYTTLEGLAGDFARAVIEDADGTIWVGSDSSGLTRIADGAISVLTEADGLAGSSIRALAVAGDGALWVGAYGGGLSRLVNGEVVGSVTVRDGLSSDLIRALQVDDEGVLWIGTENGGLNRLTDGIVTTFGTDDGLPSLDVRSIMKVPGGELILGTLGGGLAVMTGRGAVTTYTTSDGLASNDVLALYRDDRGSLWLGTNGGLSRFRGGTFCTFTEPVAQFGCGIFSIIEDSSGYLWLSTNGGILRVRKQDLETMADQMQPGPVQFSQFKKSDGMRTSQCNGATQPAGWMASDGTLWYPTPRGVVSLDPAKLTAPRATPAAVIEGVLVAGLPVRPLPDGTFVIPPGTKMVEIVYSAIDLIATQRLSFRYRLIGFSEAWTLAGDRRSAFFTSLDPGRYALEVQTSNNLGQWNDTITRATLQVEPSRTQTIPFRAGVALFMLAAAYLLHRWRLHQVLARHPSIR